MQTPITFAVRKLLLFFCCTLSLIHSAFSQTCPGQPFFSYSGGNITYAASDSMGKCYHNLVAGQTYCFSFTQPDSAIIEMDMNMSGCSTCAYDMYGITTATNCKVIVQGTGFGSCISNCATFNSPACFWNTYGPSCNLLTPGGGLIVGNCNGLVTGQIYTACYTVPASCGGMSVCPLLNCRNCISSPCTPPMVSISHSATVGCDSNTIYMGYGPQSMMLTANTTAKVASYQWFLNGTALQADTTRSIIVTAEGRYNVIVDSLGCKSDSANTAIAIKVIDIRCGHDLKKVMLCHVPDCRHPLRHTLCIAPAAITAHLKNHPCDCLGSCASTRHGHQLHERLEDMSTSDYSGIELSVFPNPFTNETDIQFFINETARITLELFDIKGTLIKTVFSGSADADTWYNLKLDGSSMAEGIYIIKLSSNDEVIYQKLVLTK